MLLFLLSAGLSGLIYLIVLYILREIWGRNAYLSVTVAYVSAMTFYFLSNKTVVFKKKDSHKKDLFKQLLQFSIMIICNFFITLFMVWFIQIFTGEVYSGSVAAGITTTILAYLVFDRIFK